MAADIGVFAGMIVSTYLLPYVTLGAQKVVAEVGKKISSDAADEVSKSLENVWNRVKSAFSSPRDEGIISNFQELPDQTRPLLETKLKEKLSQDSQFLKELQALVDKKDSAGKTAGAYIHDAEIAGIVDLRGGTVSGGNISGVSQTYNYSDGKSDKKQSN